MPNWTIYVRERLRLSGVRPANEQDVIDDLAVQLEEAYRDAIGRGLSEGDAAAAAKGHITDWPALARQVEDARLAGTRLDRIELQAQDAAATGNRRARVFAGVLHDVRFAVRLARQAPGFTAVAMLTLALGIGANTTIFSWINAVLLHPLPGANTNRIVDVGFESKSFSYTAMSYPDFVDLRSASATLDGLLVHNLQPASLSGTAGAERIWTEIVSDNFFDVLGVTPVAGRGFRLEEGRAAVPVVAIAERLSRERFGSAPAAVGQGVDINGTSFTIVGVMPEAFSSGYTGLSVDVWLPMQMAFTVMPGDNRVSMRNNHWLDALGRLKPGATSAQAAAELTGGTNQIASAQGTTADGRMTVTPLWRSTRGAQSVLGPVLLVLMAMVAIVLLITCANLANLLLSRASARRREFAVRLSLGCPRARLVRQLLTEALLLVAVAAFAAIVAQRWTSGLLMWFVPPTDFPISLETPLDFRVALFAATAAFASALIFGVAPALSASRTDLAGFLKSDRGQVGRGGARLRNALVIAQVAFSLLLLVSAGLFGRSLQNARVFDPGFRPDHVLLRSVDLFAAGYDRGRGAQVLNLILDDIRALPGVESATLARRVPLGISTGNSSTSLEPEGYSAPQDESRVVVPQLGRSGLLPDDGHPGGGGPRIHDRRSPGPAGSAYGQSHVRAALLAGRQSNRQADSTGQNLVRRRRRRRRLEVPPVERARVAVPVPLDDVELPPGRRVPREDDGRSAAVGRAGARDYSSRRREASSLRTGDARGAHPVGVVPAAAGRVAALGVRRAGGAAGVDRPVRDDRVLRVEAHARAGGAAGDGRDEARHHATRTHSGRARDGDRPRGRPGPRDRRGPAVRLAARGRPSGRSGDAHRRDASAVRHRDRGELRARPPRRAARSPPGPSIRVGQARASQTQHQT